MTSNQAARSANELRGFHKGLELASMQLQKEADLMEVRIKHTYAKRKLAWENKHEDDWFGYGVQINAEKSAVRRLRKAAVELLNLPHPSAAGAS